MSNFNAEGFLKESLISLAAELKNRAELFESIAQNGAKNTNVNLVLSDVDSIVNRASDVSFKLNDLRYYKGHQEKSSSPSDEVQQKSLGKPEPEKDNNSEEKEPVEEQVEVDGDELIDSNTPEEDGELITEEDESEPEPESSDEEDEEEEEEFTMDDIEEDEESRSFEEVFGDVWSQI